MSCKFKFMSKFKTKFYICNYFLVKFHSGIGLKVDLKIENSAESEAEIPYFSMTSKLKQ